MQLRFLAGKVVASALRAVLPDRVYRVARSEWQVWKDTHGSRLPPEFRDGACYVNAGCGPTGRPGWLNIDLHRMPTVNYCYDLRRGLPPELRKRASGIFTEHMLEHLDYEKGVPAFLRSARDSLVEGGTLRIVVPDGGRYIAAYVASGWDEIGRMRGLDAARFDPYSQAVFHTKMELVNEVFRQGGGHLYAWDFETMERALRQCGFAEVAQRKFGQGRDPRLILDTPMREPESLYVEAW